MVILFGTGLPSYNKNYILNWYTEYSNEANEELHCCKDSDAGEEVTKAHITIGLSAI